MTLKLLVLAAATVTPIVVSAATPPVGSTGTSAQYGDTLARARAERLEQRIRTLGQFGANPAGGVSRLAFSAADIAGRKCITSLMRGAGLEVRVDAAGNIIGHRAGSDPALPVIMTGSHIDSVRRAATTTATWACSFRVASR